MLSLINIFLLITIIKFLEKSLEISKRFTAKEVDDFRHKCLCGEPMFD